jgi:hypothetical protein
MERRWFGLLNVVEQLTTSLPDAPDLAALFIREIREISVLFFYLH